MTTEDVDKDDVLEKSFHKHNIGEHSTVEELREGYIERSKDMAKENPTRWHVLPDSMVFCPSYTIRLASYYIKQCHSSILDVGSGRGYQAFYWKDKGFDRVEAIDIGLFFADAYIQRGIPYRLIDLNVKGFNLPYRDNEFDVVYANHLLEHIKYPRRIVEEMVRVAKDRVILLHPSGRSYFSKSHLHFWYNPTDFAWDILDRNWVFSIEVVISNPLGDIKGHEDEDGEIKTKFNQSNYLCVIYKQCHPEAPGVGEWMWGDIEHIKKLKEARFKKFLLYLSTEDDILFDPEVLSDEFLEDKKMERPKSYDSQSK